MDPSDDASKTELALHALMELGFQVDTVRPILDQLLETYDRSWAFIEADDYNVLITAVLDSKPGEQEDDKEVDVRREGSQSKCTRGEKVARKGATDSTGLREDDSDGDDSESPPARKRTDTKNGSLTHFRRFNEEADENGSSTLSGKSQSKSTSEKEEAAENKDGASARQVTSSERPKLRRIRRKADADVKTGTPSGSSARTKRKNADNTTSTKPKTLSSPSSSSPAKDSITSEDMPGPSGVGRTSSSEHEAAAEPFPSWSLSKLTRPRSSNGRLRRSDVESLVTTRGTKAAKQKEFINAELQAQKRFKLKEKHDCDDLSKGEEKVPIAVEKGPHKIPDDFCYIAKPLVYQHAKVDISLANIGDDQCCIRCYGNCIKKKFPCSCTFETGGEFPYDEGGCLKPKFLERASQERSNLVKCKGPDGEDGPCRVELGTACKGHIQRLFLKECWSKCSCHRTGCGNRVVQQGVRYRLQVFWASDAKGFGLRALEDLPAGAFVCEYAGEILTNTELDQRNEERRRKNVRHTYPAILDADICVEKRYDDDTLLCLDATEYGNVARFINHRCSDSNLIDVPVQIETPHRHFYHVAFFTKFAVRAMEELTWDYNIDFSDTNHPIKAFKCLCGSEYCGGK